MQAETIRSRVYLFGPLSVVQYDQEEGIWKPVERSVYGSNDYASNVLKRLLSVASRRLSRSQLYADIWPGLEGDSLDNYLDRAISSIRRALGSKELVKTWRGTYEVAGQDVVWVDAAAAESLVTQAGNLSNRIDAIPLLEEALSYFQRGIYLEQESGAWVHEVRKSYEILLRCCRIWLAEGYAALGKYSLAELQYQALLQASWIDEETARYCREQQALVKTQGLASRKPVVSPKLSEIRYDGLEVDILALAWQWKPSFGPLALFQQTFIEVLRKHETTMDNAVTRRQALEAIARFPFQVAGIKLFATETVVLPASEEILPLCAAGIAACWELRQYEAEGMRAIQRILASYLPTLEAMAKATSLSQREAAYLAAQGYLLQSLLAVRQGTLAQMEATSHRARFYAQIAQDANLEVAALNRLAVKFDISSHEEKALEVYQEAKTLPSFSTATPLLQSRVYAGLASKLAYCQQADEALSFKDQAKEMYPTHPKSDPSFSFAQFGPNALMVYEGLTLKDIHRYTEATAFFSRVGSLTPLPQVLETDRAECLIYIASIATKQRDLDQAHLYLETALEIAQAIEHKQRQREVQETFQEMQLLWSDEPKVKALQEKIYTR